MSEDDLLCTHMHISLTPAPVLFLDVYGHNTCSSSRASIFSSKSPFEVKGKVQLYFLISYKFFECAIKEQVFFRLPTFKLCGTIVISRVVVQVPRQIGVSAKSRRSTNFDKNFEHVFRWRSWPQLPTVFIRMLNTFCIKVCGARRQVARLAFEDNICSIISFSILV